MNEQVNLGELELLAKLLATEDLKVQHRPVETAYFDVKARELVLPMWKDLTRPIYHLMVCHEIGHALYTPQEDWETLVTEEPELKTFVNIVEDARIERLVKALYPGSRRDFFMGYTQLKARDFFGIEKRDINMMSFIDRINIHFKLGVLADVEFTSEELVFVDMVNECQTFAEAVEVSRKIYEFLQQKSSQPKLPNPENPEHEAGSSEADGEDDNGGGQVGDGAGGDKEAGSETDEEGDSGEDEADDGDELTETKEVDEFVSETMESMETSMKDMIDFSQAPVNNIYIEYPSDSTPWIIDYKTILSSSFQVGPSSPNLFGDIVDGNELYASALKRQAAAIETLTREFQMRKAAEGYSRAKLAKSGRLDPRKLASYTLTDDVFLRNLVIKDAKNHGVVMFVDFSGSMRDQLESTFDQLLTLVQFCRKSSIPHRVYAFSQNDERDFPELSSMTPEQIESQRLIPVVDRNMRLLELFHEEMKTAEVARMFAGLYYFARHPWGKNRSEFFILGYTPLAQTMFLSKSILNKFRKDTSTQVVTAVFLTDGDDSGIRIGREKMVAFNMNGSNLSFVNRYKFFSRGRCVDSGKMTLCNFILDDLRKDGFRTVGYRIVAAYEVRKLAERMIDDARKFRNVGFLERSNFIGYDLLSLALEQQRKKAPDPVKQPKKKPDPVRDLTKELITDANAKKISRSVALGFSKIIAGERQKMMTGA